MVLTGACYDLSAVPPYAPWNELLRGSGRDATLPVPPALARVVQQRVVAEAARAVPARDDGMQAGERRARRTRPPLNAPSQGNPPGARTASARRA